MPRTLLAIALVLAPALSPAAEWTRFRGPNGQGVSPDANVPTEWSDGSGVAWAVPVPADGWSSPVVAGGKVFVTGTANGGKECRVLAFDADTGKQLWDVKVFDQAPTRKEGKNSYATPTPVAAGDSVYAVFGQGGVACVSTNDKPRWTFTEVAHYSQHGLGASPVLVGDLLVMPFDGSSPGPDKKIGWQTPWEESFILALNKDTGKEVWRAKRGASRIGHSTPIVLSFGGKDVLVSQGGDVVQGFDPKSGSRLWSVTNTGEGLVPSPVIGDKVLFTTPGWPTPALRAWGWESDDPTAAPKQLWQVPKNVPMMPSAVFVNGLLFAVSEKGIATCLDPKTGAVKWEERLPGSYSASLVSAGGKVYALSEQGEATVFDAAPEFNAVARNKLPGVFQATPAIADGRLYLRSDKQLFRVGR